MVFEPKTAVRIYCSETFGYNFGPLQSTEAPACLHASQPLPVAFTDEKEAWLWWQGVLEGVQITSAGCRQARRI